MHFLVFSLLKLPAFQGRLLEEEVLPLLGDNVITWKVQETRPSSLSSKLLCDCSAVLFPYTTVATTKFDYIVVRFGCQGLL